MTKSRTFLAALAIGLSAVAAPAIIAPAAAATVDTSDPGRFVTSLSGEAFRVLRTGSKASARGQFRQLLGQYFAVDAIGDRLIRSWRAKISPAQYQAYQAALPGFLINTYADRLYDYADAKVAVTRSVPRGNGAAVVSQVTRPGGNPVTAIWTVETIGGGPKITNLTVAGVNLVLTQTADFDSYIQKNGFDKLVAFMRSRAG
ncbi:MlaC/ttg2D family ABC transporter substrate-binding protein [Sphingomonas sp.]|uniref:MlaC/ttg2D family ABC transporter substrate-binding protein n=1 Tax=Sphingomonas sp. TaxID=28214 RepID=UPI003B00DBB8